MRRQMTQSVWHWLTQQKFAKSNGDLKTQSKTSLEAGDDNTPERSERLHVQEVESFAQMSQRKLKGGKVWPMHNESAMSEGSVATAPKKLDLRVIGSKARTLSSQDEEREIMTEGFEKRKPKKRGSQFRRQSCFYRVDSNKVSEPLSSFEMEEEAAHSSPLQGSMYATKDVLENMRTRRQSQLQHQKSGNLSFRMREYTYAIGSAGRGRCMIRINSNFRVRWDLFVMMLAVINCVLIPFDIAFLSNSSEAPYLIAMNTGIDLAFLADIIINFRTSYVSNKSGEQITEKARIFRNYCMGRFWLDLAATIPIDRIYTLIAGKQQELFNLFGLLKVLRVMRLQSIINNMNIRQQLKMTFKIANFCFLLVLYVHLVACMWYYIVRQKQAWVPPIDFMWYQIYDVYGDMEPLGDTSPVYSAELFHKYWVAVYHSVLMLTGNEVGPRTTVQTCFAGLTILLGAIINAYIFGHMAVLITSLEKNSSQFQERMDSINTSMKNMHLSKKIQRRVQNYLLYTQSNHHHRQQLSGFLKNLSPSLQNEVLHFFFEDVLRRNPVLKEQSQQLHSTLVKQLDINYYQPDDVIIQQGEPEKEAVFFLVKGACTVTVRDYKIGKAKYVRTLRPSSIFGEVGLLYNCKRTASVNSINYSIVARLGRANFDFICSEFPELIDKLKSQFNQYNDPWRNFLKNVLKAVPYFNNLPAYLMNEIVITLKEESVKEGKAIVREGDECQSVIFVTKGEVELCVTDRATNELEPFETLKMGSHLGALWVLQKEAYHFTARAKTDVTLHHLPSEVLMALAESEAHLEIKIAKVSDSLGRCQAFGGVTCDIKLRASTADKPIKKFARTVHRMVTLSRYRKHKPTTSEEQYLSEQCDKMFEESDHRLQRRFTVQDTSPCSVLKRIQTRQFSLKKHATIISQLHHGDSSSDIAQIKEELRQLRAMVKILIQRQTGQTGISKPSATETQELSISYATPRHSVRRKGSSFSRMVARDLGEDQEKRKTSIAMRRSQILFGTPQPQQSERSQQSVINPQSSMLAAKKSLNCLAFASKNPESTYLKLPGQEPERSLSQLSNYWIDNAPQRPKRSTQKLIKQMEDLVGSVTPVPNEVLSVISSKNTYQDKEEICEEDIAPGVKELDDITDDEDEKYDSNQPVDSSGHRRLNSLQTLLNGEEF